MNLSGSLEEENQPFGGFCIFHPNLSTYMYDSWVCKLSSLEKMHRIKYFVRWCFVIDIFHDIKSSFKIIEHFLLMFHDTV